MEEKFQKEKEKILNKLDFPSDIALDMPKIIVVGNREITIENHKGIIAFENNMVKINSRIGPIIIRGSKFEIIFISENSMKINGIFNGISYEENKNVR